MANSFSPIVDFIRSQYRSTDFIPLHVPRFGGHEKEYVVDTIESTFVSSVGAYVDRFEELMQDITGCRKAVAVVNGTAALQVALRLAGVQQNDLVITQALTFVATANAIRYNAADPLFIDVDIDTMGLSPKALKEYLESECELRNKGCIHRNSGKRISACVPMHTFGFPCRIEEIVAICEEWQIPVVEDAAESMGSTLHGKPTGAFGKMGVFSFNGNKIVTSGGGGAIVTHDEELGQKGKYLTTTAKMPHSWEYFHDELGYNYRMPNLNAALACAQLEQLESFVRNKRQTAQEYEEFFRGTDIHFRTELPNTRANYWLMAVEFPDRKERDLFLKFTNQEGIMTRPIWQLMYKLPMYENSLRDAQTNAEYLEDRIVNLPSSVRNLIT